MKIIVRKTETKIRKSQNRNRNPIQNEVNNNNHIFVKIIVKLRNNPKI